MFCIIYSDDCSKLSLLFQENKRRIRSIENLDIEPVEMEEYSDFDRLSHRKSLILSIFLMIPLPHDRSDFFSTTRYWNAVEKFLEFELKNDGDDISSQIFLTNQFFPHQKILKGKVEIICKEQSGGILAGKSELIFFLDTFFPEISYTWGEDIEDGSEISHFQKIFWAEGNPYDLMKLERVFLNILSRMSGIATNTKKLSDLSKISGNTKQEPAKIAATRKTQWSYLDKKAVHIGGGLTHRMGLFDAIMLKENHQIMGRYNLPVAEYLSRDLDSSRPGISPKFLEIEVETPEEFQKIFDIFWNSENSVETRCTVSLPKVIMLDNFSPEEIIDVLKNFPKKNLRHQKNIFLEASGGISETNISEYIDSGVDVVSMGCLTNFVKPIDFSMRACPA